VTEQKSPSEVPTGADGTPAKRPKGRPKSADAPVVPWIEVDRILVHGERVEGADPTARRFPSFKEVAKRYGVSQTRIWQYAARHRCMDRRKEAEVRELVRYDQHVAARRADARALCAEEIVAVVDEFIRGFKQAMDEGKIRFDSPADLDKMVRLRQLVTGGPDARTELTGTLTLEAIQQRYRLLRGQVENTTPEFTGTAAPHTSGDEADDGLTPQLAHSALDAAAVQAPDRRAVPADAAPAADEGAPGPAEDHARRVPEAGGPAPVNGVAAEPPAADDDRPVAHDDLPSWLAGMDDDDQPPELADDDDDDLVPGLANLGGELELAGGEEA
jgi:hypothetical protein